MVDFDHGPRLSDEEYDRRIVELQAHLPPEPTREQEMQVRRRELDLAIDHRLGKDFPKQRREQLWVVQQRVSKKRVRLIFKYFLWRFFRKNLTHDAQKLAGYLVDEYATVLSKSELELFFGADEVSSPNLPIDTDHFYK